MDGLNMVMLADAPMIMSSQAAILAALIFLGPIPVALAGLILALNQRKKWALAMVTVSCGTMPVFALIKGELLTVCGFIFLEWDAKGDDMEWILLFFLKLPFILGVITLVRVGALYWYEKNQRRNDDAT